jgi:hypothetical protein
MSDTLEKPTANSEHSPAATLSEATTTPAEVTTTQTQVTTIETTTTLLGPLRKTTKKQLLVNFTPRLSTLDPHNQLLHQNPLRGLYALFWILLGFHIIATLHASGSLAIQSPLARLFSKHLPQLAIADFLLVTSTFSALGFAKVRSS